MARPRVVLGVSGGIAAYKACEVLRGLTETGHDVHVVPTASALRFVGAPTWSALSGHPVSAEVWDDAHEVPHVRIGQQAVLVLVVPATAGLLARAAHGMADDLLTSTLLTAVAWIFAGQLIDLLFGSEYEAADSWLGPLCLAMALYGLGIVHLYHFLALGRARFAMLLGLLLAAQVVAYGLLHDSPGELIGIQIAFGAATVGAAEAWYLLRR